MSSAASSSGSSSSSSSSSQGDFRLSYTVPSNNPPWLDDPFKLTKYATTISQFFAIIKPAMINGTLDPFLSQVNSKGQSLREKIRKKSSYYFRESSLLTAITRLQTSSFRVGQSVVPNEIGKPVLPNTIGEPVCFDPQDYRPLLLTLESDLDQEELDVLEGKKKFPTSFYKKLRAGTILFFHQIVNAKKPFDPMLGAQPIDNLEHYLCKLLHYGLKMNFPNLVQYLVKIGVDINGMDSDDRSVTLKAVDRMIETIDDPIAFENSFDVFSILLKHRKPISPINLAQVIHLCSQNYRKSDSEEAHFHNDQLLNHALSILLGIKIAPFFSSESRLNALKYLGHAHEITGTYDPLKSEVESCLSEKSKGVKFEYWDAQSLIHCKLRLLLEIIVENPSSTDQHTQELYDECLLELETGWITQLCHVWRNEPRKKEITDRFCGVLAEYISLQVQQLPPGKEYYLQTGWPNHIFCIAFTHVCANETDPLQHYLQVRVDNVGAGANKYHELDSSKKFVHPKIIAQLAFQIGGEYILHEPLQSYLKNVIFTNVYTLEGKGWRAEILEQLKLPHGSRFSLASVSLASRSGLQEFLEKSEIVKSLPNKEALIGCAMQKDREFRLPITERIYVFPKADHVPNITCPWSFPKQIVANCTYASFSSGMKQRLTSEAFDRINEQESALLRRMSQRYSKQVFSPPPSIHQFILPSMMMHSENFSIFLHNHLSHYYEKIAPRFYFNNPPRERMERVGGFDLSDLFLYCQPKLSGDKSTPIFRRINGSPGGGKTVYTQYYAKQCQTEITQGRFDFIFLIPVRNLSKQERYSSQPNYSLVDLVDREIIFPAFNRFLHYYERVLLDNLIATREILWILDGLDELSEELPQFQKCLTELNNGKNSVMYTSRPGVNHLFFRHPNVEILQINQFSESQIISFIEQYFERYSNDEAKKLLLEALQTNPPLKTLCEIPLLLIKICQSVIEGDDQILKTTSLARLTSYMIMTNCQTAFKRKFKDILKDGSEGQLDLILKGEPAHHHFRRVLRFLELLAFTALEEQRSVTCSREIVERTFFRFGLTQELQREQLLQDLYHFELHQIDPNGFEFSHTIFLERHAASYLIKALNQRKVHEARQMAQVFVEKHKTNYKYHNVFAFVVHQLCDQIRQTEKEHKKNRLVSILHRFLGNFSSEHCTDPEQIHIQIQNLIPLLDIYGQSVQDQLNLYEEFLGLYRPVVTNMFTHLMTVTMIQSKQKVWGRDIVKSNIEDCLKFFIRNPRLIEWNHLFFTTLDNLHHNLSESSSASTQQNTSRNVAINYFINLLDCWRFTQSFDSETLERLIPYAQRYQQNSRISCHLIELILTHLGRIISKPTLLESALELNLIDVLLSHLFSQEIRDDHPYISYQTLRGKVDEYSFVAKQVAAILPGLYQQKDNPLIDSIYLKCRDHLIQLTAQVLEITTPNDLDTPLKDLRKRDWNSLPTIAREIISWERYWNSLPPIPREIISWGGELDPRLINRLIHYIYNTYNLIWKWDKDGKPYPSGLSKITNNLGPILARSWNLVDLFNPKRKEAFFRHLICFGIDTRGNLTRRNGYVVIPKGKFCEAAQTALKGYRPDFIGDPIGQLKILERIYFLLDLNERKFILDYLIQKQTEGTRIDIPEGVAFEDSSIIQGGGDLLSNVIENMKKRIVTFQHEAIEPLTATPIEAGIDEDLSQ